ncbi:hypothetical protein GWI33_019914 [Rhynchophorus ferrugineus]|uniref:Pre-mRNA cleavage complex 2 protein Pcf11 n=1 Tax=Rhynchophorus ferrugineus TaxID=354439 RepID=A0A834HQH7_RHYFE|nr:hypothetical protein GWI33_019914 [Rhynchophorus ferrugineus]
MTSTDEIKAEYTSSLADLTFNSKPLINVLTILAEENLPNAKVIVEAIEEHLSKVSTDVKLPILYLIDCIVKNVGQRYTSLFSHNIVSTFSNVFKVVDEKTRSEMFKLRQTWNEVFPPLKLYAIDVQINTIDPAWPVTAQPTNSIHLNPKFLKGTHTSVKSKPPSEPITPLIPKPTADLDKETLLMQEQLLQKQKELLELQRKTLELEVLQTQVKLQEQMKAGTAPVATNILLKPEVAKQLIPDAMSKNRPTALGQRLPAINSSLPKVNPVNAALAAAKPIRDPRLLRQQKTVPNHKSNDVELPGGCVGVVSFQKTQVSENNKNVSSKQGVRDIHKDPRLSNKPDKKSKTSPKSHPSPNCDLTKSDHSPIKSDKSSSSSSTSSLDSPTKSKSRSSSSSNSSSSGGGKHRKRDKPESGNQEAVAPGKRGKMSSVKPDNGVYGKGSDEISSAFKNIKNSTKGRNYIRRNVNDSPVLQQDEDLRGMGKAKDDAKSSDPLKPMDVDLRQFHPNMKKRSSAEGSEQPSKKSKSFDIFDRLFGNEDTDLRQLAAGNEQKTQDRPPTPPPPIISSKEVDSAEYKAQAQKNNLDAVRAKLANATNREKVLSKSFNKKRLQGESVGDLDLRSSTQTPPNNIKSKIMISPEEEESIKSGHMTKEQEKNILNKIFFQIEKDKLREAKQKDNEEAHNVSLQPISDDEFASEEDDGERSSRAVNANEKEERFAKVGPASTIEDANLGPSQFYPRDGIVFRPGLPWRSRGRGMVPQMGPQIRPPRPWMHQQPMRKWRGPWSNQSPDYNQMSIDDESSRSPGQEFGNHEFTVHQEDNKTLSIDGMPRDIRIYNASAVIFLNWDDPREISFQSGMRRVIFNNKESYVLSFGDGYKECLVNGYTFRVKLGVPSREIFINDVGFECFFGGAPVSVTVNDINLNVQLEGPPPQVKISDNKRTDLVLGKINLIINAKIIVPVFLDAKVQKFVIDGETSTLKFVDSLKRVLINDVPFNVEFGGLPKPFIVHGKKHFIRFSVLPKGVKPGSVRILDMDGQGNLSPRGAEPGEAAPVSPLLPDAKPEAGAVRSNKTGLESPENRSNSPSLFNNILQQGLNNFDVLSNVLSTSFTSAPSSGSYQVENGEQGTSSAEVQKDAVPQPTLSQLPPININDLFQKLVASGFVKTAESQKAQNSNNNLHPAIDAINNRNQSVIEATKKSIEKANNLAKPYKKALGDILKPLSFGKPETLKIRQAPLYSVLYSGMQCSSCGMRFPPEASMLYSQHLDWHFRQNRRGKKNARVASSRRWYYSLADWKNYEEIEDLEEREKNYFDQQQQAEMSEDGDEDTEIPTVPADPGRTDETCQVCRDTFEQFFNEEKEEWHLKNAIKVDDKTYHPVCFEDYNQSILETSQDEGKLEEEPTAQNKIIPGLEIILDDDDDEDEDDRPVMANEVVSLPESDESKNQEDDKNKDVAQDEKLDDDDDDGDDDDVILNEVAPIKIVVDDDDDDDDDRPFNGPTEPTGLKKENHFDDGFVDVGEGFVSLNSVGQIKIKSEPVDEDEIPSIPQDTDMVDVSEQLDEHKTSMADPEPTVAAEPEQSAPSHLQMITSIDGNVELVSNTPMGTASSMSGVGKIKINISKSLPVIPPKESSETSVSSEPDRNADDSEETVLEEPETLHCKPDLKDTQLKKLPKVAKGSELTGLCSIM